MQIEKIEALIGVLENSKTKEITVEKDGNKIKIIKGAANAVPKTKAKSSVKPAEPLIAVDKASYIKSGRVGILHLSDKKITNGSSVHRGQIMGTIESMKVFNDVSSDTEGIISEVYVEDGMPVEFGQLLFKVEPAV